MNRSVPSPRATVSMRSMAGRDFTTTRTGRPEPAKFAFTAAMLASSRDRSMTRVGWAMPASASAMATRWK